MMAKAPRSIHLLARRTGGGTESNVHRLVDAVDGFEVAALEDTLGYPFQWSRLTKTIRSLRAMKPKVVFCYGITSHVVATLAWPSGPPLIGSIRCESDFAGAKSLLRSAIAWRFSHWISNSAMALGRLDGEVIYNGIDIPEDEAPLLPNLPKPVFGILARGHAKKRHDFAMELWQRLGKPGSLVFAGSLGEELEASARAIGVHCPGHVAPGPLLRSLDMLWVPSDAEGIPTVMLEAMVRGVPCLATPVGGIPELITPGDTGYLLKRDGWEKLLKRTGPDDWAAVGTRGREHVRRDFTFDRMVKSFVAAAERFSR